MKYILSILIAFIIVECKANEIRCQLFNETTKSFEIYCERLEVDLPIECYSNFDIVLNPLDVLRLKICGCDENKVPDIAKIYTKIRVLDISYSRFMTLAWLSTTVQRFKHLQIINASHNELHVLSPELVAKVPELTELDLSFNQLSVIGPDHFTGATNLRKVNLANNILVAQIHTHTFYDSSDLESIDLRENHLSSIQIFQNNEKLNVIHLESNEIIHFHCLFMARHNRLGPVSLYISWTHVYEFDLHRTCKNQHMRVIVNNESDSGIFPTSDGKREFHCHEQSFDYLVDFYANDHTFENVLDVLPCLGSSVEILDLSNNFIGKLDSDVFDRFTELTRLYLRLTKLTEFYANSYAFAKNLRVLDISRNNLRTIENISSLSKLENLFADGNALESVREIVEKAPKSLTLLDLSDGKMDPLTPSTFDHLRQLQTLVLRNTSLTLTDFNPFDPVVRLLSLDISENNFSKVDFDILSNTFNILKELSMVNCQITNASPIIQKLSVSIEQLNLSGNDLAEFDLQTLEPFFNLRNLNLSNCNLTHFDTKIIRNQQELNILDLSRNKLYEFDAEWLPVRLEWLNLNWNNLSEIYHFGVTIPDKMALGIFMNRLPCSYLMQLKFNFDDLIYIGDPLKQKHNENCRIMSY